MNKKAQGLSMNVIIIAAIALLVLVILAVLILRAGSGVAQGTDCTGIGGICTDDPDGCRGVGEERGGTWIPNPGKSGTNGGCPSDDFICCSSLVRAKEE
ncbi:MAG: hypothetical protein KKF46_06495 [Nanoarchaeota archaeon]|nr:hypothetical protein [Nanoarchaeota archaeon]MBU1321978.1 hypothetical protein [Nanoarchaeota archaeon]MBU1598214.1 hypothetical protein [Nanoarchaeota archaeon]MBU2441119.1 hypothetical protein [Nanoarchaeota archaeon]